MESCCAHDLILTIEFCTDICSRQLKVIVIFSRSRFRCRLSYRVVLMLLPVFKVVTCIVKGSSQFHTENVTVPDYSCMFYIFTCLCPPAASKKIHSLNDYVEKTFSLQFYVLCYDSREICLHISWQSNLKTVKFHHGSSWNVRGRIGG